MSTSTLAFLHPVPPGEYDDWYGTMYPVARARAVFDPLAYVASYFNLIEINSTFYRVPCSPRRVARRWLERVEVHPQFRVHGEGAPVVHPPSTTSGARRARGVRPLRWHRSHAGGRLGAVLLQYPVVVSLRRDPRAHAPRRADAGRPANSTAVAVEVRHGSWGVGRRAGLLAEKPVAVCGIDPVR